MCVWKWGVDVGFKWASVQRCREGYWFFKFEVRHFTIKFFFAFRPPGSCISSSLPFHFQVFLLVLEHRTAQASAASTLWGFLSYLHIWMTSDLFSFSIALSTAPPWVPSKRGPICQSFVADCQPHLFLMKLYFLHFFCSHSCLTVSYCPCTLFPAASALCFISCFPIRLELHLLFWKMQGELCFILAHFFFLPPKHINGAFLCSN